MRTITRVKNGLETEDTRPEYRTTLQYCFVSSLLTVRKDFLAAIHEVRRKTQKKSKVLQQLFLLLVLRAGGVGTSQQASLSHGVRDEGVTVPVSPVETRMTDRRPS